MTTYTTVPGLTAIAIAQDRVRESASSITDFFAEAAQNFDMEPSVYFGPISSHNLIEQFLLNPSAEPAQLAAAAKELQARFFACWKERIELDAEDIEREDAAMEWAEKAGVFQ